MNTPKSILDSINQHTSFLAHAHVGPDPDTLGSIIALKLGLESIGKTLTLYCEDEIPVSNKFISSQVDIALSTFSDQIASVNFDIYLCLDTAKWALATYQKPLPEINFPVINIDHHPDNNINSPLSWIEPKSPSTTALVYHLLNDLNIEITPPIATAILYGLIGDTGVFQNYNTDQQALDLASKLIQKGADYQSCITADTRSLTFDQLKAYSILLANMHLSSEGDYVWTTINYDQWQQFNPETEIGGFGDQFIGRVIDTKFGAVLVEKQPGITKGSLRSRLPEIDVAQIAHLINGGGHKVAAGFRIEKPLKEAETDFINAVEYIKRQGKL